jgi:hypothetical protein
MIIKNPVLTAKKTQLVIVTKINWLTLFEEIIAASSESNIKPINTFYGQNRSLNVKADGTYSYHPALKG